MHKRSQIALAHPCFEAEQCAHSRFGWRVTNDLTAILTVNIGLE